MASKPTTLAPLHIAVVSDLHCCASQENQQPSFLIAGSKRTPVNQHLVQSLLAHIQRHSLTADVVICPGDLAHQVCPKGIIQSWDHLGEIQRELQSPLLLTTIGNHDVDSRKRNGPDPFDLPKTMHPFFPRPEPCDRDMFWNRGFYHATIPGKASFIVLNTVIGHQDYASAERGTFGANNIEGLADFLKTTYPSGRNGSPSLRVAVMHHHPIVHSTAHYGSSETLEFGDQILDVLGNYGFSFVVHGHRHEPRISRHKSQGQEQLIFASGAFSAQLGTLASRTKNLFHLVDIGADEITRAICGRIRTWEFTVGCGWEEAAEKSARIPYESAITCPQTLVDVEEIIRLCDQAPGGVLRTPEMQMLCPQLLLLLPSELNGYKDSLRLRGYKLVRDEEGNIVQIGKVVVP